jgi:hypothetical protein
VESHVDQHPHRSDLGGEQGGRRPRLDDPGGDQAADRPARGHDDGVGRETVEVGDVDPDRADPRLVAVLDREHQFLQGVDRPRARRMDTQAAAIGEAGSMKAGPRHRGPPSMARATSR